MENLAEYASGKKTKRRRSEQPQPRPSSWHTDARSNRSLSPTAIDEEMTDVAESNEKEDFRQTLAQMYWETKADMLSITEDSLKLKLRIRGIKQQFLHVLTEYEAFEQQQQQEVSYIPKKGSGLEKRPSMRRQPRGRRSLQQQDLLMLKEKYQDVEFINDEDSQYSSDRNSMEQPEGRNVLLEEQPAGRNDVLLEQPGGRNGMMVEEPGGRSRMMVGQREGTNGMMVEQPGGRDRMMVEQPEGRNEKLMEQPLARRNDILIEEQEGSYLEQPKGRYHTLMKQPEGLPELGEISIDSTEYQKKLFSSYSKQDGNGNNIHKPMNNNMNVYHEVDQESCEENNKEGEKYHREIYNDLEETNGCDNSGFLALQPSIDGYEIDVDESIDMQMRKLENRWTKESTDSDTSKDKEGNISEAETTQSSNIENNPTDHDPYLEYEERCTESSARKLTREEYYEYLGQDIDSSLLKNITADTTTSTSESSFAMEGKIFNILKSTENQTPIVGRRTDGTEWGPEPEEVLNEVGLPIMNPLLRDWLETQQRISGNDISLATRQKIAALRINSMMDSFPDPDQSTGGGNEAYIPLDGSYQELLRQMSEVSDLSKNILPKLSFTSSMSSLQKSLSVSRLREKIGNSSSEHHHLTYASDQSSGMEGIIINQVDFPSQSDTRGSDKSIGLDNFPLNSVESSGLHSQDKVTNLQPAMNNLDVITKDGRNLPPEVVNIPTAKSPKAHNYTCDFSFEQSIKDISDITKFSDLTTSRLQISHAEVSSSSAEQPRTIVKTPTRSSTKKDEPPQHSTPEKDEPVIMETPKYEHHRRRPAGKAELGSRPSPTGSDNTPKAASRYSQPTPTASPQCHKEHSSSECSCFDESTPMNTKVARTRRSLGVRQSLGSGKSDCSGSNDDVNDRTPVVCRHGRIRVRTPGIGGSNSNNDDSAPVSTPTRIVGSASPSVSREHYLQQNEDGSRYTNNAGCEISVDPSDHRSQRDSMVGQDRDDQQGAQFSMEATRDSEANASLISVPLINESDLQNSDISTGSFHMSGLSSCQESSYKETDVSEWSTNSSSSAPNYHRMPPPKPPTKKIVPNPSAASSGSDIHAPVNSPNCTDSGNQASGSAYIYSASSMESLSSSGRRNLQQRALLLAQARSMECLEERNDEKPDNAEFRRANVQRSSSTRPPCIGKESTPAYLRPRSKSHSFRSGIPARSNKISMQTKPEHTTSTGAPLPLSDEYIEFRTKVLQEKPTTNIRSSSADETIDVDPYEKKKKPTLLRRIKNMGRHFRTNSRTRAYLQTSGTSENE